MTRDPRQDPRPGEVVRVEDARGWAVYVVASVATLDRGHDVVRFAFINGREGVTADRGSQPLSAWRERMAAATVLHPLGVTYDGSPALADDLSDGRWSGR